MAADQTHFIVIAVGSAGDIYPFMSLARTLQLRGHKITFIGPLFHIDLIQQAGIPFYGIGTREQYLAAVNDPDLWHPRKGFAVLCRDARSFLKQLRAFFATLPSDEHCVILAHPLALPGAALSRATRPDLKIVGVYLAPAALRTCHDPLTIGPLHIPGWFPMAWRRWLWDLVDSQVIDAVALPDLNADRRSSGLPPVEHFMDH